jgi:hypothetical protein
MSIPEAPHEPGLDGTEAFPPRDSRTAARTARAIEATALGIAVGASAGFAFVEAPAASRAIDDLDVFADLIGTTIDRLTRTVAVAGSFGAAAAVVRARLDGGGARAHVARFVAVEAALALLYYHARVTVPKMNDARRAMGRPFKQVPVDDPARVTYRRHHVESTRVFGTALLLMAGSLVAGAARER